MKLKSDVPFYLPLITGNVGPFGRRFLLSLVFQRPDIPLQAHHLLACPSAGCSDASRSLNHLPTRSIILGAIMTLLFFRCCVSSLLVQGPILLSTRQRQWMTGNHPTTTLPYSPHPKKLSFLQDPVIVMSSPFSYPSMPTFELYSHWTCYPPSMLFIKSDRA